MQQLEAFFHTATDFCRWTESKPASAESEADTALKLLSKLYSQGHELPDLYDEEEAPALPHEEWLVIYKRFGALPFNYYAEYCEPHNIEEPVPAIGDLADDLADIWRDLKAGLSLYHNGNHAAAAWQWRHSFHTHWGRHAASAIYALQYWRQ
jgi:hypothetical protein